MKKAYSIVGDIKSYLFLLVLLLTINVVSAQPPCIPSLLDENAADELYFTRVQFGTIDNIQSSTAPITSYTTGTTGPFGYQDYTSLSTDFQRGATITFTLQTGGRWIEMPTRSRYAIYINWNDDGDFEDGGEMIYRNADTNVGSPHTFTYTIPPGAALGPHTIRFKTRGGFVSDNACLASWENNNLEIEDYTINITRVPFDTSVMSNSLIINDESTTPAGSNNTNFGSLDVNSGNIQKIFTIVNDGLNTINLTGSPIVGLTGSTDFSIISQPLTTTLSSGQSTTFTVQYDPSNIATHTATISINNTDPIKNPYNFLISGEGKQTFPDTDGDGITDNIDQDDDNDGILDGDEQNLCVLVSTSRIVTTEFLRETFGQGTTTVRINDNNPNISTTYCFEDNTAAQAADECDATRDVDDGQYTISSSAQITDWALEFWHLGGDHTGDTNGRMAIFNADPDPGEFYKTEIDGIIANVPVTYSFWALNLDTDEAPCLNGCPGGDDWDDDPRLRPRIRVEFRDEFGNLIASKDTGDIDPTDKDDLNGSWKPFSETFTPTVSKFTVTFINDQPGGLGNDLALDDIVITQELCDLDGDGVADVIDIDNDNDGIPNIIEIGRPTGLATVIDPDGNALTTGSSDWVDSNSNGVHDAYENPSFEPLDTDGDGVPDYLDLDSDNDGIFDVLENDGFGDIDINGNGIGQGNDSMNSITDDLEDGDGLLNPIDNNDIDIDDDDHGTLSYALPIDTDGDLIPDYLDIDSNDAANDLSNGSDIDNSLYADQDGDGDGRVDTTVDVDRDGVNDGNNDFDTGLYGAPIDVTRDLFIDFDGRNDYIQSSNSVTSGLNQVTMMAWVLMDPASTGTMSVMGDGNMDVSVTPSGTVSVNFSGASVSGSVSVNTGIASGAWYHLTAVLDGVTGFIRIYVNGNEEIEATISPINLGNSTELLTLGRSPRTPYDQYFNGGIDEVKVFTTALTATQLRRMMHQEVEADGVFLTGKVLPRIITGVLWSDLLIYYSFNELKADILSDESDTVSNGTMFNIKSILPQTAPLPYFTKQDGDLSDTTTLAREDVWDADHMHTYPHSIIQVSHEVEAQDSFGFTGMVVDNSAKIIVKDGFYIENDWYFILNGEMILEDDAQLLQTSNSELDPSSAGNLSRNQEGERDVFSYNYWSSPVGRTNTTTNNNDFYLTDLIDAQAGLPVQFTGINTGTPPLTSPVTISGRWLYTFINGVSYNDWARVNPVSTPIGAGIGWSQKGTGTASTEGFMFKGKPNNGEITISAIDADGDPLVDNTTSLLGNPYPSAIDIRAFIDDNLGVIDGTVYIWDQFRGTNHQLAYYEGGYATVTKLAAVKAAQYDGLGFLNGGAGPAIEPTFFMPVSQGFFVTIQNPGNIVFNNSQRIFKQESLNESIFLAAPGGGSAAQDRSSVQDVDIKLLRLDLEADTGASRQIAIGFSPDFTDGFDYGYDAAVSGALNETDLYSPSQGKRYIIKSLADITVDKVVDIAVKGVTTKLYKLKLSEIQNISTSQDIFLVDHEMGINHDFRTGDYHFTFSQNGTDENRFDIVFEEPLTLSSGTEELNDITVYHNASSSMLYINGLNNDLTDLALYDMSGKLINRFRESELSNPSSGILTPSLATGIYLVTMQIEDIQKTVKLIVQ